MEYSFFNASRGDNPEDLTRLQASNVKYSSYMLDNPLVASAQPDHVVMFASHQHLIPHFSVNGNPSDSSIDTDSLLKKPLSDLTSNTPTYYRLGSTTPYLAKGSFMTDMESQLKMAVPTSSRNSE
jgi:hypothetical protein